MKVKLEVNKITGEKVNFTLHVPLMSAMYKYGNFLESISFCHSLFKSLRCISE